VDPAPNNADRDRPLVGPAGAAWVFTRSQGASVAVSADGNTAIVAGPSDNRTTGAAWVRSGDAWTQQGNKLIGSGAGEPPLPPSQGMSVAVSADGNTAIVGGWGTGGAGVATVFTRRGGGSDSQELARPSATSNPAVNFEE
jgi:hypothetical protein